MFRTKSRDADESVQTTDRVFRPWAAVAAVVGVAAIVLGAWALIETGLDTENFFGPREEVLGLPHTSALALGEIGFGVLLLVAATSRAFGPLLMTLLGAAAVAFGVLVVTNTYSGRLDNWTAANDTVGWMFIIVGAITIFAAAVLPTMAYHRETITRDRVIEPQTESRRHWWQSSRRGSARA